MSRTWKLVAGIVVGILVVVVGGRFAIHLIQGKSAPPLKLSTAPGTAASSGPGATTGGGLVAVDGVWQVSGTSTAGYRIKETLFGQSNTAVGRTSAVTGSFAINATTVSSGSFTVDLTKVRSDRSQRDGQFQGRIMNTSTFPTARFTLTQPIQLTSLPADGVQMTEKATGDLTLHGVTKSVTFQLTAQRDGAGIQASGAIPITFADYSISNPSGGPATTEDHGSLEFLLNFAHAQS